MQLSDQQLMDLKKIWQIERPGEDISTEELLRLAEKIIKAVELIYSAGLN